jgi:hypothetical protein
VKTTLAILGVLALLLSTGTAAADGIVYAGYKDGGLCVSVLDGKPVRTDSKDCEQSETGTLVDDIIVGVDLGGSDQCVILSVNNPAGSGLCGFLPPIVIIGVGKHKE